MMNVMFTRFSTFASRAAAIAVSGAFTLGCGDDFGTASNQGDQGSGSSSTSTGASSSTGGSAGGSGGAPGSGGSTTDGGAPSTGGVGSGGAGGTSTGGSGGTASGGGPGHSGPCYDEPCAGTCVGDCTGGFTCDTTPRACTADEALYCGCDGENFTASGSCPDQAYLHRGSCEEGVNCDPADIVCTPLVAPEPCPEGQVRSVVNGCHGECVPIGSCRCEDSVECPEPSGGDQYVCIKATRRCSHYLQ